VVAIREEGGYESACFFFVYLFNYKS
jgi:hypothetical protein